MDQFKFPASLNAHSASTSLQGIQSTAATSPTPSSPLITVATPLMVARSKRKSIPMRSPSWTDSQEFSPGVIFQMPFGFPRSTTKSPSLAGSDDGMAGTTPPSHYPSPASSTRHSGSVTDMNDHGLFAGQATPASPITRSGLGIRVQEDFSEPEATHPLDQPAHSFSAVGVSAFDQNQVTSTQEVPELMDIERSTANPGQDCMPTPPSVSMISAHRMETSSEGTSKASPTGVALDTPKSEKALAEVEPAVAADRIGSQPQDDTPVIDETQVGSKDSLTTAQEEDMSLLPLWAQRQQSIRRQSLIPRSELDFVKGSGILPPPSTDLVIPGGARIKAYPPLLSDIVKYQEELDARNAELESEAAVQNATSNGAKRRKIAQGKGRGSISAQGMRHEDDVDGHQGTEHTDLSGLKRRRSSQAQDAEAISERQGASRYRRRTHGADDHGSFSPSSSPPAQDDAAQQQHGRHSGRAAMLGSPVELNPTSVEHGGARRGLKGKGKQTKARQSVIGHQHHREWSWDEARDMEHDQHHDDFSDVADNRRDSSHQRRASVNASTQLTSEKSKSKKGAKGQLKKTGRKNSVADLNDSEDDYEGRERFRRVSLDVIPGADAEMMAMHNRGYQLKTLKPLLNAIQSGDEATDGGSLESGASKGARGGNGSSLQAKRAANHRATDAFKVGRKRSIQEELIDSSTGPSKKAKNNGTSKTSKKSGSHVSGAIKHGRKIGSARHSIHGPFDESLAMAEALMEMHDGMIDDDETEDEFAAYTGGADNEQGSDSQDDHNESGERMTMKQSAKSVKHKKAHITVPKFSKAAGAPSPQLKKKKTTAADPSKPKQQNKRRESTSGAGHHGGHSFDSAGQGPSSGSGSSSKRCEACDVTDTPCWRPGYSSNTSLCNSCGLRYKKCNVFCTRDDCKYIPLKMEYTAMEEDRIRQDRDHLICVRCKGRVALPTC
ncbi:DNA-binding transcription repressor [Dissophora ornata]|nr:DNA-binding transcription repressor [Dissophora ornata]